MRKLLILAAAIAISYISSADVLYWMVGDDYDSTKYEGASLYAVSGDTTYQLATKDNAAIASATSGFDDAAPFSTDLGSYTTGWSYYVELINGAKTDPITYRDAVDNGYIAVGSSMAAPKLLTNGAFGQAQTYNVPEPTSGLLFVIGGMLLGLKRKRQV